MLPHSTVAGIHFVTAVASAYKIPVAVGIVAAGAVELEPSGIRYSPAVAVGIVAAVVVGVVAADFVVAIVAWATIVPGAAVYAAARCIVHSAAVISTPLSYPTRSVLSPFSSSLSNPGLLPFHMVGSCAAPSYMHPRTFVLRPC